MYKSKNEYRSSFNVIKPYVKLGVFADRVGLNRSSLSKFLKNDYFNYCVSVDTLDKLYNLIKNTLNMNDF